MDASFLIVRLLKLVWNMAVITEQTSDALKPRYESTFLPHSPLISERELLFGKFPVS
jgi:hypothetical protein